jgi:hypothetical protein
MSRRNWGFIIAAVIGLAAIYGFGLGCYFTGLNHPDKQGYQSYRYATDKPQEVDPALKRPANPKAFEYRAPCEEPKGKDESDLCAQWRAAEAGENSAFWAEWGFWITILGSGLLLWQIALTREAVQDTGRATEAMREANEIARDTAHRQLRAYLTPKEIVRDRRFNMNNGEGEADYLRVQIIIQNTGQTPAVNLGVGIDCIIAPEGEQVFKMENVPHGGSLVGAGLTTKTAELFFPLEHLYSCYLKDLSVYLKLMCIYRDVISDESHETITYYRLLVNIDPSEHFRDDKFMRGVVFWQVGNHDKFT